MGLFAGLLVFWAAVLYGAKRVGRRWRKFSDQRPVRFLSEIKGINYYRRLAADQFESLVRHAFKARQFMLPDDPYLGRSKPQGYAWKAGKKTVVVHHPAGGLTSEELDGIAKRLRVVRAEQALVFYPYPESTAHRHPDVRVLSGKMLLAWFSVLDFVPPPVTGELPLRNCECGALLKERVSRVGEPLLVCERYPDCRAVQKPQAGAFA